MAFFRKVVLAALLSTGVFPAWGAGHVEAAEPRGVRPRRETSGLYRLEVHRFYHENGRRRGDFASDKMKPPVLRYSHRSGAAGRTLMGLGVLR